MAFTIPDTEPESLVAGVSWKWDKDLADYKPDDGWTLIYYFVQGSSSPADFSITTTNVSNVHNVDVEEAVTVLYTPDTYYYQGIVNNGTDTHLAITGQMEIVQDYSDGSVADPRSWACQALDALETSIAGTADATQLSYEIDGIQVSEMSGASKLSWLEGLRRICAAEKEDENLDNGRKTNRVGRYKFTRVQ
jgi:hypothetical protein|tara:strand:+ start:112 stop:687 length:576 start_codon:yes stop_codon:yes gene_type:complete